MSKLAALGLIGSFLLFTSAASAQPANDCELHIWPTSQIGAVFNGAYASWNGYGAYVSGLTLTPLDQVGKRLGESIDPVSQVKAIEALNLFSEGRLAAYRPVFHDAPSAPKYSNWISKDVGIGARDTDSNAACYAELHIIFVTLFRTSISKKIQTAFLYREFGSGMNSTYRAVDAGSTGAPDFASSGEEKTEVAKASVVAAFQENVKIFLRSKKNANPQVVTECKRLCFHHQVCALRGDYYNRLS